VSVEFAAEKYNERIRKARPAKPLEQEKIFFDMNKTVFYLVIAVMAVFFTACGKKDLISYDESYMLIEENPFVVKVANVENGSEHIAFATFYVTYHSNGEWPYLKFYAKYENGGFELIFPATIPDEYLQPASNRFEDVPLSDTQAKIVSVQIDAHNSADATIGDFSFRSDNWAIEFKYADRDFTVKGVSKYGVEFDCSYEKGWNVIYHSLDGKKITTQKPLNENFKSYFSYLTLG